MPAPGEGDEAAPLSTAVGELPAPAAQRPPPGPLGAGGEGDLSCLLHDWLAKPGAAAPGVAEAPAAGAAVLLGLSLLAAVFWALGVTLPIVVIRPLPFGEMEPIYKSTLGTLQVLWEDGHLLALLILTVCSVVLPVAKAITTTVAILSFGQLHLSDVARKWLDGSISVLAALSSYQCVDLLLGILFVAFLPDSGFISASIQWGFFFFAAYCVASQAALLLLQKRAAAVSEALSEAAAGALAEGDRTGRGASEPGLLEASPVEAAVLGGLLLLLILLASAWPLLEVSIVYEGFCLERSRLGLLGVAAALADEGGAFCGCLLALAFVLSVAVAPLAVAGLALLGAVQGAAAPSPRGGARGQRWLRLSREVAHWALPDVFALALVTFTFTMQDSQVATRIPVGWFSSFHGALGIGAVGFALRWATVRPRVPVAVEEQAPVDDEGGGEAAGQASPRRGLKREWNWDALSFSAPVGPLSRYELRVTLCPARAWRRHGPLAAVLVVWALGCVSMRGPPAPPGLAGTDEVLQRAAELGNRALAAQLPRSIGDCRRRAGAPEPCRPGGHGALAEATDETYGVDVMVRWATGVDTVRLISARALRSSDAERPVQIVLDGVIQNLTLSMRIQKCYFGQCDVLFDNTDGCCEPDRRVRVAVTAACRDGAGGAELEPFLLKELVLDRVYLKETLFGFIRTNVADLSNDISLRMEAIVKEFLSGKRRVLGLTLNEVVAGLWRHNVAEAGTCAELVDSL